MRYGETIQQILHPATETPCADSIYQMAELHASSSTPAEPGSLDLVAQFDAMAAHSRAKRRSEGGVGSATADTTPTAESVTRVSVPPVSPRKKRRTKAEMQQFRADKARQIETSYRELVPEGHFLDAPDEATDALMETLRESDA